MMYPVERNIETKGRAARGAVAAVFLLLGACLVSGVPFLGAAFIVIGLFMAFEAFIGWCAVRACGFKTPF
jgi:hypothetical protein